MTDSQKNSDNTIFIGGKPLMNYVTGVVMQFTTQQADEVKISSRGKFISKAVDVAEVARKRFLKELNISIKEIKIDSQEFEKDDKKIHVSTIDIILKKD
jgi:DNA-binding protein